MDIISSDVLNNLYFRQSMVNDYLKCPQLFYYRYIAVLEQEQFYPAALFGTAGHEVIREMHEQNRFNFKLQELSRMFAEFCVKELKDSKTAVSVSTKYSHIQEQIQNEAPFYVSLLNGYQKNDSNSEFNCIFNEQRFVLRLPASFPNPRTLHAPQDSDIIFTGTIDQAGWYPDGRFALRDIKFRDNAFRPGRIQQLLDLQINLYSYSLKHGLPACDECAPVQDIDGTKTGTIGKLFYNGPCEDCEKKIGTAQWPGEYPQVSEILWMRDYEGHKRDEHEKFILHPTLKERNPDTGRMRKKRILNPEWKDGYKKGDPKGSGSIAYERSPDYLFLSIVDATRIIHSIRSGFIFRRPSNTCNFECPFSRQCIEHLETEADAISTYVPDQGDLAGLSLAESKMQSKIATEESEMFDEMFGDLQ